MEILALLMALSVALEGVIYYVKSIFKYKLHKSCIASILLGIFVAIVFDIDMFNDIDILTCVPYVGNIITGLAASRGGNYAYDAIGINSDIPKGK